MISEAAVEAVGGAVGSVIAVGVTYPLTTVSKERRDSIRLCTRMHAPCHLLACMQISTWQALDHKESRESTEDAASITVAGRKLPLPTPFREIALVGCGSLEL